MRSLVEAIDAAITDQVAVLKADGYEVNLPEAQSALFSLLLASGQALAPADRLAFYQRTKDMVDQEMLT